MTNKVLKQGLELINDYRKRFYKDDEFREKRLSIREKHSIPPEFPRRSVSYGKTRYEYFIWEVRNSEWKIYELDLIFVKLKEDSPAKVLQVHFRPKSNWFMRMTPAKNLRILKRIPRNSSFIVWKKDTLFSTLWVQLNILALQEGFLNDNDEQDVYKLFRDYMRSNFGKLARDEDKNEQFCQDVFNHIKKHYFCPTWAYSFDAYITSVKRGIIAKDRRHESPPILETINGFSPTDGLKKAASMPHKDQDSETDSPLDLSVTNYSYQDFGNGLYGIDRTAYELGLHRDFIYRAIKDGEIHTRKIRDGNRAYLVIDESGRKALSNIALVKKEGKNMREDIVLLYIMKKNIHKKESAERWLRRQKAKGLSYENIGKILVNFE